MIKSQTTKGLVIATLYIRLNKIRFLFEQLVDAYSFSLSNRGYKYFRITEVSLRIDRYLLIEGMFCDRSATSR